MMVEGIVRSTGVGAAMRRLARRSRRTGGERTEALWRRLSDGCSVAFRANQRREKIMN